MPLPSSKQNYEIIVVGTGFASSFFLQAMLKKLPAAARVLVLERGKKYSHQWQLEHKEEFGKLREDTFVNRNPRKPWVHTPVFGGGSNCWWGCTPRFMPADFALKTRYGVGRDWPVSYDDLEPFYQEAEELMAISGPSGATPYPRSRPYPQPPHRFTDPDRILKKAYPDQFFEMPCARARIATSRRPACCASGVCELCPMDAKFTIMNELAWVYDDPRVTLALDSRVEAVDMEGGRATGVQYVDAAGAAQRARATLVALGANALFNPHILLRSGLKHPQLGARLNEQLSVSGVFDLDGIDNFQGSTSLTGHGYMLYDGPHRAQQGACLIETSSIPDLRLERGKWRRRMQIKFIIEDLPDERNRVGVYGKDPAFPEVYYEQPSSYGLRALEGLWSKLETVLKPLPIERLHGKIFNKTEAHILGTVVMGNDPADSVVDRKLAHHQVRNLLVLGGSAFPTSSPANPTLTIAALSLWAAHQVEV
jgi:choline dehydrogenase-like flavoprotein